MLDAYRPISLMLAGWPTPQFEFPADAAELGDRLREHFTLFQEKQVMQIIGPGAPPPELARLILLGQGRQWILELAPAKLSLRRMIQSPEPLTVLFDQHRETWLPIQSWLAENHNLRIYRLGLVVQFFCDTRSSANERIAGYFLQPRALQGQAPHEVHVSLLARLTFEPGIIVNRWLRVQPLRTSDPRRLDFAAKIEVDVNTLAEDTQVRSARELTQFLETARRHIETEIPVLSDPDFLA
jgi:hypothetical protein